MTPYYEQDGIVIYLADCRDILPSLHGDVVITDPVWPNAIDCLAGSDNPTRLFAEAAAFFPAVADRAVIQLGCNSDPRFLMGIPAALPFFRVCWLEYACPSYMGRLLMTGDVAYAFGTPPPSRAGRIVIPGKCTSTQSDWKMPRPNRHKERGGRDGMLLGGHPCPRRLQHVAWLVKWFADGTVIDPFMGSGTTLLAAKLAQFSAIGIEVEEKYCEVAAKRLVQGMLDFSAVEATQ